MTVAGKGAEGVGTSGKGMEKVWALFSASDSNPGLLGGASDATSEMICSGKGVENEAFNRYGNQRYVKCSCHKMIPITLSCSSHVYTRYPVSFPELIMGF